MSAPEIDQHRHVIVVDTETTGLDHDSAIPLEVAWENIATGESGCFVPPHNREWVLRHASPQALEVNGYRKRIMYREQDDWSETARLRTALTGNTLFGSAPAIDAAMLAKLFRRFPGDRRPWHHRVVDLSSYAAGVLGLPLGYLPGLWDLSGMLGVVRPDHGAMADVRSTVACLRALEDIAAGRAKAGTP